MRRLAFLVSLAASGACVGVESRETPPLATRDCQVGELGWWHGPLRDCSWYPFSRKAPADDVELYKQVED